MSEIEQKIVNIKAKRDEADQSSMVWIAYNDALQVLERSLRGVPKLHIEGAPACEGCQ